MQTDRLTFINLLIKKRNFKNYLEIGVFLGKVFFFVKATHKTAVDPQFRFGYYRRFKRIFKSLNNLWARFYQKTSDEFFREDAPKLYSRRLLDICLVDGMHEYEYALRDVENTLLHLDNQGVILMHDCNPAQPQNAVTFEQWKERNYTGLWNGDVWKSILHLRSMRHDINVFVLDCDQGIGVVTWDKPENKLNFTKEQIQALTYDDLAQNRTAWLNLKEPTYFFEYFGIDPREAGAT
jgi:hypothetical protein